jgi:hypothetical protein
LEKTQVAFRLSNSEGANTRVFHLEQLVFDVQKDKQSKIVQGITIKVDESGKGVALTSGAEELLVTAEGYTGWQAVVPTGNEISIAGSTNAGMMNFITSSNNNGKVTMTFSDGGKAQLDAGSYARFDLLNDQTYYLSGRGKIHVVDADGQEKDLNQYLLPLTGGPLKRYTDRKGAVRWNRMSPLTEVSISGPPGGELEIVVGEKKIILPQKAQQHVELANGTTLDLVQNANSSYLDWKISKGCARFWVGSVECWSAAGMAGQEASMIWDAGSASVDITSYTPSNSFRASQDILVTIARNIACSIPPGVGFQYMNVNNCNTFTGAAENGEIDIYNPTLKQVTTLTSANKAFKNGMMVNDNNINPAQNNMQVSWDSKGNLNIRGSSGDFQVAPNSTKLLEGEGSSSVAVNYDSSGQISFTPSAGSYGIDFDPAQNMTMEVQPQNRIDVKFDRSTGFLMVQANANNDSVIHLRTGDGQRPQISPGGVLAFIVGREGSTVSRNQGTMIFYESGGAAEVSTFGVSPVLGTLNSPNRGLVPGQPTPQYDISRIVQVPASVLK